MFRPPPATARLVTVLLVVVIGSTAASVSAAAASGLTAVDSGGSSVDPADTGGWQVSTTSDELAVSGRSNRPTGTTVVVELAHPNGTTVRSTTTTVSNGTWRTTLDVAGLDPGTYHVRVTDGEIAASTTVELVSTTPSETPFESTTSPPSDRRTSTATLTAVPTPEPIPSPVPTLAQSPGFDVGAPLAALLLSAGTLAWRRHRWQ